MTNKAKESPFLRVFQFILVMLVATVAYFWRQPANTHPEAFELPKSMKPSSIHDVLGKAEVLWKHRLTKAPETFAFSPNGKYMYTGTLDGKILSLNLKNPKGSIPQLLATTGNPELALPLPCGTPETMKICGRPYGLETDSEGDLYIADGYLGLMKLDFSQRRLLSLLKSVDGKPLKFTNSIALLEENDEAGKVVSRKVYFTDSSHHQFHELPAEMLEAGPNGRVIEYDTITKRARVVATGLHFANGILVTPDQEWVIVSELTRARLVKIGIAGYNYGRMEMFSENLPVLPDNLSWGPIAEGDDEPREIWIGSTAPRYPGHLSLLDALSKFPKVRKVIAKVLTMPIFNLFTPKYAGVLRVDAKTGKVIDLLEDSTGRVKYLAEARYHNGYMYLGSYRPEVRQISRIPWSKDDRSSPLMKSQTSSNTVRIEL